MNPNDTLQAEAATTEAKFGEDNDRPNPGIETVRTELSGFAGQRAAYDPEIFDGNAKDDGAAYINRKDPPEAFLDDLHGKATYLENDKAAGQINEIQPNIDWQARELRTESLRLASRNHQGRGIPVEMLIDEARIYAAYIETGDVPDFAY